MIREIPDELCFWEPWIFLDDFLDDMFDFFLFHVLLPSKFFKEHMCGFIHSVHHKGWHRVRLSEAQCTISLRKVQSPWLCLFSLLSLGILPVFQKQLYDFFVAHHKTFGRYKISKFGGVNKSTNERYFIVKHAPENGDCPISNGTHLISINVHRGKGRWYPMTTPIRILCSLYTRSLAQRDTGCVIVFGPFDGVCMRSPRGILIKWFDIEDIFG